jgi:hypothetical protein
MERKYSVVKRYYNDVRKVTGAALIVAALTGGYAIGHMQAERSFKTETVESNTESSGHKMSDLHLTAGVEELFDVEADKNVLKLSNKETTEILRLEDLDSNTTVASVKANVAGAENEVDVQIIRCTGYNDIGYTKSGEYTRDGIIAGKEEWLGRTCNLYRVNEDGTMGDIIGSYEFLDTGYGINGSLIDGTSVDVWHPTEKAVWDWVAEYGDYVYIEFTS